MVPDAAFEDTEHIQLKQTREESDKKLQDVMGSHQAELESLEDKVRHLVPALRHMFR